MNTSSMWEILQIPVRPARMTSIVCAVTAAFGLAGCATSSPGLSIASAGLNCVDDTPVCIDRRQAALRALLSDRQRAWVHQRPSPSAYASGVRLFAFKKSKKTLTCPELGMGIREAKGARASLRSATAHLTPAQIARGAMLGDEVARELSRESKRRCKRG